MKLLINRCCIPKQPLPSADKMLHNPSHITFRSLWTLRWKKVRNVGNL